MYRDMPEDVLVKLCTDVIEGVTKCVELTINKALDEANTGQTVDIDVPPIDSCLIGIKTEKPWECKCPDALAKNCDCSDSPMGLAVDIWFWSMIGLGAGGCFLVLVVAVMALIARQATKTPTFICLYSTCSGMFSLIFIAIGGAFILLVLVLEGVVPPKEIKDYVDNCETKISSDGGPPCLFESSCKLLRDIADDLFALGLGIGVPYFAAGIAFFLACYACCCCKPIMAQDSEAALEEAAVEAIEAETREISLETAAANEGDEILAIPVRCPSLPFCVHCTLSADRHAR